MRKSTPPWVECVTRGVFHEISNRGSVYISEAEEPFRKECRVEMSPEQATELLVENDLCILPEIDICTLIAFLSPYFVTDIFRFDISLVFTEFDFSHFAKL
jgi:hypothetical protein